MPGQILGDRYEVEQQLGKKSGRWTLLARDLTTETPVILKLLFIDDQTSQDDLRLFTREVDILQTLSHPATPKYLGYFEIDLPLDGKALALIQSYIEGKSLDQYLQEGRQLTEAEAKTIARSVLEILEYLHDHTPPIVHRDIKPSNILLASEGSDLTSHVALVDFGSVKSLSSSSDMTTFTLVGTDGYRPPEQIGRRAVRASDLYSLGATLVTGITGIHADKLPRRGLRIDLENCLETSSGFNGWLRKMIEPELEKRFKSAQEAYSALP
ncbi:serine/threonine protein kinase [Oscillatoria sp. FACHB-1407]|uniref:serine/threonine protein kinase n=1 Tax=Oscillatoria sp. FACHB-1407 TaxID=2692847 RepID=UPI0016877A82|nr:serine/threonine-protein kinase [Oscillatoria sp. FACHB-1407]MBD2460001.1 serine/threonine protein kinase [Oscillatoria sp. FACHB-1407]